MVAAPLVAMGMVYPDGHDLWGQSEPGVKMMLNVLLLPVLLILGLLIGMCLSYVVIRFTALGFHAVGQNIIFLAKSASDNGVNAIFFQGTMACLLVLMYASFLVTAFQKCFSAIHVIPEKVLMWIGAQGSRFGEQEMQQFSSSVNQASKEVAQAGGQTMTQGIQANQGVAKAQGEGSLNSAQHSSDGVASGMSFGYKAAAFAMMF